MLCVLGGTSSLTQLTFSISVQSLNDLVRRQRHHAGVLDPDRDAHRIGDRLIIGIDRVKVGRAGYRVASRSLRRRQPLGRSVA